MNHIVSNWDQLTVAQFSAAYPIVFKELQDEGDGAAVDAYEQVDTGQGHICGTWDVEYVGHGVHHGRH